MPKKHSLQGNQGVYLPDKVQNDEAKAENMFKGKQLFAFQIFFYCQFEVPFRCTVTWTGQTTSSRPWTHQAEQFLS